MSSGSVFRDLARYPKLVGGIDDLSAKRAVEFYESVLEFEPRDDLSRPNGVWDLGSSEAAELTKLAETTYRDVNIGLANEFARYADSIDVDVFDVIAAANSQPYSHIHRPGIAVGGHCIPVYPRLYLSNDPTATLPRAARAMNSAMPGYAVDRVEATAGPVDGKTCLILGVAYRGGVKETAFSGAFPLRDELVRRGAAVVSASDPMYSSPELASLGFTALESGQAVDVVFVQTDHASYRDLGPDDIGGATTLFDGRRCVNVERFTTRGVTVIGIGTGAPR